MKKGKFSLEAIEAFIFDIDGTLIDSNDAHAEAWVLDNCFEFFDSYFFYRGISKFLFYFKFGFFKLDGIPHSSLCAGVFSKLPN